MKKLRVLATGLVEQNGAQGKLRSRSLTPSAEKIRVTALTLYTARNAAADDKRAGGADAQNSGAKDDDSSKRGVDQVSLSIKFIDAGFTEQKIENDHSGLVEKF